MAVEITSESPAPRSSIQIEKNSRGVNWTAKTYANDGESDDELLARVDYIVAELTQRFGGGE